MCARGLYLLPYRTLHSVLDCLPNKAAEVAMKRNDEKWEAWSADHTKGKKYIKIAKNTRNPDLIPIFMFRCFPYFYQNWANGLDFNRFCAPELIIEKSNSSFF